MRQPPDQLYDNAPRSTHWSEKVTSTLTSMARRKASPISSSTFPLRMLRSSLAVLNLEVNQSCLADLNLSLQFEVVVFEPLQLLEPFLMHFSISFLLEEALQSEEMPKGNANRVATVIANEWKDENDKFMPSGWKIED
ncbi:hypothetical protein Prudu_010673 [Prunus dulcis]|uniref:Uncharacterized protein n=1 Tax=Prunus dulcis TaxID=3755 RepID=A0A4Y1R8W2_PRUDU|nr:hypothetical protein Prudu_010673 [Prunus dulcis]